MPDGNVTFYGYWIEEAFIPVTQYIVNHHLKNSVTGDYDHFEQEFFMGHVGTTVYAYPKTGYVGYVYNGYYESGPASPPTILGASASLFMALDAPVAITATSDIVSFATDDISDIVPMDGVLVFDLYYDNTIHNITYTVKGTIPAGAPIVPTGYSAMNVPFGSTQSVMANLSMAGYVFSGWHTSDAYVDGSGQFTMPFGDVEFYGTWSRLPSSPPRTPGVNPGAVSYDSIVAKTGDVFELEIWQLAMMASLIGLIGLWLITIRGSGSFARRRKN